ncbi:MAG TPA: ABC transporter substrate-binding protein [Lachnoclostridium sp.]|jgi:oligogalacturonide transport system substrate-binding protein|uniref:ABC transporter substrate-binding protein n=1 Tax=Lacrimispora sp. TaxID=2719234 RepID=UPI000ED1C6A0|nr:ABC transporter substrate-binding protein [Lacrimispora sp.]HCD46063.1 ABC transporter substrate-binding protein [Lachnoclostridium sp.]
MKKIKQWAAMGLATVMAVSLSACGGGKSTSETAAATTAAVAGESKAEESVASAEPVELRFSWWGGDSRHAATEEAIKAFEAKYPNITVAPEYGAWTGWEEKQSLNILGGNAPDVMQINWNWIESYSQGGTAFANLEDYADVLDLTQFTKESLELCKVDNKLMAVPISSTGRVFYWNKTAFEEVGCDIPTDLDSLYAAGEAFKAYDPDMYPMALGEYDRAILFVYYLESKYGKNWVEDGKVNYTQEEVKDGMDFFKTLEEKHVTPTAVAIRGDMADSLDKNAKWIDGKYAGIFEWDSSASKFKAALEGSVNKPGQEFVVGEFIDMGDYDGGFTKISMAFAVAGNSKHPKEAAMLINFLLNEEEGVKICSTERGIPNSAAGLKILADNNLGDPLTVEANTKVMNYSKFILDSKFEHNDLKADPDGAYYKVFGKLSTGEFTSEQAASELIKAVTETLEN